MTRAGEAPHVEEAAHRRRADDDLGPRQEEAEAGDRRPERDRPARGVGRAARAAPSASPRARRSASVLGGRGHGGLRDMAVRVVAVHRQRLAGSGAPPTAGDRRRPGSGPAARARPAAAPVGGQAGGAGRAGSAGGMNVRGVRRRRPRRRRAPSATSAPSERGRGCGTRPRGRATPASRGQLVAGGAGAYAARRCGGDRRGGGRASAGSGSRLGFATSATRAAPAARLGLAARARRRLRPSRHRRRRRGRRASGVLGRPAPVPASPLRPVSGLPREPGRRSGRRVATAATTAPHDEHAKRPASTGDSHSGQTTTFVAIVQPRSRHPF